MATIFEVAEYADRHLQVSKYKDYCPNGLQIEGLREVRKLVCGVTASLSLIHISEPTRPY